jgi:hypothetical protein
MEIQILAVRPELVEGRSAIFFTHSENQLSGESLAYSESRIAIFYPLSSIFDLAPSRAAIS